MEDRPNYYAVIPAEVRYDKDLKDKAKLLYGEISALSNKDGYCYASNSYFAELYGITNTTVSLLIKNLVEKGYLETEIIYKEGTKEILKRYLKIIKGGYLKKLKEGIYENLKDNNTSINNTSINIYNNNIYEFIEQNFGRTLSPLEYEEITEWKDTELTRYAIKQSVISNKCSIKYISRILNAYERENIKTVQQAQEREREYVEAKKNKKEKKYKTAQEKRFEMYRRLEEEYDN